MWCESGNGTLDAHREDCAARARIAARNFITRGILSVPWCMQRPPEGGRDKCGLTKICKRKSLVTGRLKKLAHAAEFLVTLVE
jgi:hypothetical protein